MRTRPSFRQLQALRQQVNRLVDGLLRPTGAADRWLPEVDILDADGATVVQVNLPGLAAGDVVVELCGRELKVRGSKRRLESEPAPQRFHLLERFVGAFHVTVELTRPADPGRAAARFQQGVLTVVLPHLEDRRNRAHVIAVEDEVMEIQHD